MNRTLADIIARVVAWEERDADRIEELIALSELDLARVEIDDVDVERAATAHRIEAP